MRLPSEKVRSACENLLRSTSVPRVRSMEGLGTIPSAGRPLARPTRTLLGRDQLDGGFQRPRTKKCLSVRLHRLSNECLNRWLRQLLRATQADAAHLLARSLQQAAWVLQIDAAQKEQR